SNRACRMDNERPGSEEREDDGRIHTQPGKRAQIDISAVQVVTVDDVGSSHRQGQKRPRPREAKVFDPAVEIKRSARLTYGAGEAPERRSEWGPSGWRFEA